ncbi:MULTISPECIES: hypothetical protein [Corallococcus]|uniref:hypothetical protein n=1 Tax=Corallococcus TaxID=83461 RepID=UPI000EEEDBFE|nr:MULTISPECIES: hypothetical protein [Corallococcus]NPC71060.1 hypothetical protein [Corallococcus exiguus]NPD23475.1 hypothetical protein [Corallococcus exiguus]RKI05056.1 hypothetical protein D7Y04_09300 [Corallococcus sp. AB038B]
MAIDFMSMPISRYIVGDFITPAMRSAWERGVPYSIIGPEGARHLPEGLPFGGPAAPERRASVIAMLVEDLRQLPDCIATQLWDENSDAAPRFHRVDTASYEALVEEARKPIKSFLGIRKRGDGHRSHVAATLFLPCDFDAPFEMVTPLRCLTGSTFRALDALERMRWPLNAEAAAESLRAALMAARESRVPMIVDW